MMTTETPKWHDTDEGVCRCTDGQHWGDIRTGIHMTAEYANALETRVARAEAKATLADEVIKELHDRDRLSAVDALVFPRLSDYELSWLARYDALDQSAQEE